MISTMCAVPLRRMRHWTGSLLRSSLWSLMPVLAMVSKSFGWFRSPFTSGPRMTRALIFLSRNTVPMPPRPACFSRMQPRRLSYQEKFSMPMRLCSAADPALTTEMFTRSFSSSAYMWVRISASTWLSTGSAGAVSTRSRPFRPSMKTISSWSDLPWISRPS